jgi:hypothetical protein
MESAFQQALKNIAQNFVPQNILNQARSVAPMLKNVVSGNPYTQNNYMKIENYYY